MTTLLLHWIDDTDPRHSLLWGKSFLKTLTTMEVQREDLGGKTSDDLNSSAIREKAMETKSDVLDG